MNLNEAILSAIDGNFVTSEYFDADQSLHCYNHTLYYEDGAVIPDGFLESQDFAVNGKWSIAIPKENVDFGRLKEMHERNDPMMLSGESYMDCRKS